MDLLDVVIVVLLALGGLNGYRSGLFKQLTRLFGVIIAYALARYLRPFLAPAIDKMHLFPQPKGVLSLFMGSIDNAIAFAIIFLAAFILLRYGAGLIDSLFRLPGLSFVNRLAGFLLGVVFVGVFIYIATLLAHYVPNQPLQHQLKHSAIVQWIVTEQSHWTGKA